MLTHGCSQKTLNRSNWSGISKQNHRTSIVVVALLYREIERVMDLSSAQWDLGVLDLLDEELLSCRLCPL